MPTHVPHVEKKSHTRNAIISAKAVSLVLPGYHYPFSSGYLSPRILRTLYENLIIGLLEETHALHQLAASGQCCSVATAVTATLYKIFSAEHIIQSQRPATRKLMRIVIEDGPRIGNHDRDCSTRRLSAILFKS